jgi:hypothetical protein
MSTKATTQPIETTLSTSNNQVWWVALKHAAIALVISTIILIAVYSIWFFEFHPEFAGFNNPKAEPTVLLGNRFRPIGMGSGGAKGNTSIINGFTDGKAGISVGTSFRAEDYPFIKFDLEGLTRFTNASVYWRRAAEPEELYQLPLNRSGDEVTQVAMVYGGEHYKGLITELVIVFFDGPAKGFSDNNDVDIAIKQVELRPFSPLAVAGQIWEDWVNPPLWQGYSNNIVRGIHGKGMVFPNLALNLLVAISVLVLVLAKYASKPKFAGNISIARAALVTIGLCWALGDSLRWQWRIEQLIDTQERYAGLPLEQRIRNNPIRCARFPKDCKADLLPYF